MRPKTYFASPERTEPANLENKIKLVSKNPLVDSLLKSVSGIIAVLDENRQIISVNEEFLKILGIDSFYEIAGLRPGEALGCNYSAKMPGGCGTSRYCSTCGAAIAITAALANDCSEERICALKKKDKDNEDEICLVVRCSPLEIEKTKIILMFIRDITKDCINSYIEKVFFHDINNLITALFGNSALLELKPEDRNAIKNINLITERLKREVEAQRLISQTLSDSFSLNFKKTCADSLFNDLKNFFKNHPASKNKNLEFSTSTKDFYFHTDCVIIFRVLGNMILNALEASSNGDTVKIRDEKTENKILFHIWNKETIPEEIQLRIFQRFFTTKSGNGRGIGTFSMKLLGEKFLKGKVYFKSTKDNGTTFTFEMNILSEN